MEHLCRSYPFRCYRLPRPSICRCCQEDTGPAPDVEAIHHLIERYTKAVDTVDLNLLAQIWSHSPEVSFIYPLGEEHGFDAIEQHVFKNIMGGMFSARDLEAHGAVVHVNGNTAWSEFHWVFRATMRKDGSSVTTHGVETQIYRKQAGAVAPGSRPLFRRSPGQPLSMRRLRIKRICSEARHDESFTP